MRGCSGDGAAHLSDITYSPLVLQTSGLRQRDIRNSLLVGQSMDGGSKSGREKETERKRARERETFSHLKRERSAVLRLYKLHMGVSVVKHKSQG